MDDKSTAGDTMKNSGVPTVPGSNGLYFVKGIRSDLYITNSVLEEFLVTNINSVINLS